MASIVFNENSGVEIPETSEVREDLANGFKSAFQINPDDPELNTDPTAPFGQIVDLITAEVEAKNAEIAFISNMNNVYLATGKFLDSLATLYGLSRKISEPTIVTCTCTGLRGTVIPYGAIVQDVNNNQFRCNVAAGVTIGNTGTVDVTFAAIEKGALVVSPNAVNQIITSIAGWETVNNATAGVTGRVEETDAELRNRIQESYAINSTGSVESLESNLAQLSGVIDVAVLENYTNSQITKYGVDIDPHSIAVCVSGGEDADIASIIYARKDVGCGTTGDTEVQYIDTAHANTVYRYNIIRPISTNFYIYVDFFSTELNADLQAEIKQALINDFLGVLDNDRVKLASEVFSSRFYQCIQNVTNAPIASLTIALGSGTASQHVTIDADVEPTLAAENITLSFLQN